MSAILTRRSVLAGGGALVLAFSLSSTRAENKDNSSTKPALPGSLEDTPRLDAWIRIDRSGAVTILTGKAELGQGVKTALLQIAAE
jgi:CO/xanthine dehydrogenase Mo-binding subunit